MNFDEAKSILYGNGGAGHRPAGNHELEDILQAHAHYLRNARYDFNSAVTEHHGQVLACLCEAMVILLARTERETLHGED